MTRIKETLGWVPNLFTLSNLTLGFFSILISTTSAGNRELLTLSGAFILLAMLCDGLDGFAARLLDARSALGAQLDSLADLTAFGIAPAALMYSNILSTYNYDVGGGLFLPTGMLISAIFPACAAFRLARFNVVHDEDSFAGLPSPVAGVIVALMPLAFGELIPVPELVLIIIFVLTGFLMVSTVRYAKPQVTVLRRFSPVRLGIVIVFLAASLVFVGLRYGTDFSAAGLFTIIVLYVAVGVISLVIHAIQEYRV